MGEIQANDIDPGAYQIAENGFGVRSGAKSGYNLGAALRDGVGQAKFSKRH
jgi:hypothetical protein